MRSKILLSLILLTGCKLAPLEIDPCTVLPEGETCYAVPINQPDKLPYERPIMVDPPDVCITADEYAETQKRYRELLERCGDRCF